MEIRNNPLLKLAEHKDLKQITEIYNWAVMNTVATFDLKKRTPKEAEYWYTFHQDKRYPIFTLEDMPNGKILGWGSISPYNLRAAYYPTAEFSIYISPEEFGRGYGTQILSKLCEFAQNQNFHSLIGIICAENEQSLKLSCKHGFEKVGHLKEVGYKFNKWLDIIIVQKVFEYISHKK